MPPRRIGKLTRRYVLDVLFWPRDEKGEPLFPEAEREKPLAYLYDLAVKRGLPHEQAKAWAKAAKAEQAKRGKQP